MFGFSRKKTENHDDSKNSTPLKSSALENEENALKRNTPGQNAQNPNAPGQNAQSQNTQNQNAQNQNAQNQNTPNQPEIAVPEIQPTSEKEKKAASMELKRYQKEAESLLNKRRRQNPVSPFFLNNFLGKKIRIFRQKRLMKKADAAFQKDDLSTARTLLKQALAWDPNNPSIWFALARIALNEKQFNQVIREATGIFILETEKTSPSLLTETRRLRVVALLAQNKLYAALNDAQIFFSSSPQSPEHFHLMGALYLTLEQSDKAIPFLKGATQHNPNDFKIMTDLGRALFLEGDFEESFETHLKALQLLRTHLETHSPECHGSDDSIQKYLESLDGQEKDNCRQYCLNLLCQTAFFLLDRDQEQAEGLCREILAIDPQNHRGLLLAGTLAHNMENWEKALEFYQKADSISPARTSSVWNIGDVLYQLKRFDEAIPWFKKSIAQNFNVEKSICAILASFKKLNQMDEIERFCSEMIRQGWRLSKLFHARSEIRFQNGNILAAIQDLKKASSLDPDNFSLLHDRAILHFFIKDFSETLRICQHCLQKNPDAKDLHILSLLAMKELGRLQETLDGVNEFLDEFPNDFDAVFLKAQLLREMGNYVVARKLFQTALDLRPNYPLALLGKVESNAELGNLDEAVEGISSLIQKDPENLQFILQRALYFSQLKRFDEAVADCETVMKKNPEFTDAWVVRGEVRRMMKRPEAAILDYQRAVELDPQNTWSISKIAELKISLGLFMPAIEDLEKILKIDPKNESAALNKIFALEFLNKIEEALEFSEEALKNNENNFRIRFHRAVTLLRLHKAEEALNEVDLVVKNDDHSTELHLLRATILNALSRHEEALRELELVLDENPDSLIALCEKAVACFHLDKNKTAFLTMNRILEMDPDNAKILNMRGTLFLQKKKDKKALHDFMRSVEIQPDFAPAFNNLGRLLTVMGKPEKAAEAIENAITLAPNWARPYLNRAILHLQRNEFDDCENDIQTALENARDSGDEEVIVEIANLRSHIKTLKAFMEKQNDENGLSDLNKEFDEQEKYPNDLFNDETDDLNGMNDDDDSNDLNDAVGKSNWRLGGWDDLDFQIDDEYEDDADVFEDKDLDDDDDELDDDDEFWINQIFDDDHDDDDEDDELEDEDKDNDEDDVDFDDNISSNDEKNSVGRILQEFLAAMKNAIDSWETSEINQSAKQSADESSSSPTDAKNGPTANDDLDGKKSEETDDDDFDDDFDEDSDDAPSIYWQYFDFAEFEEKTEENRSGAAKDLEDQESADALFASILEYLNPQDASNDAEAKHENFPTEAWDKSDNSDKSDKTNETDGSDDEETLPKKFTAMFSPFIIYCPQFIVWKNAMQKNPNICYDEISDEDKIVTRTTYFFRYQESPEKFIEALTMISEILEFQIRRADKRRQFKTYREQKKKLLVLMEEISANIMENEVDMLLVFTNSLKPDFLQRSDAEEK